MDPTWRANGPPPPGQRHVGHAHFWERALSRGQFIGTAAGATGVALSAGLGLPTRARAARAAGYVAGHVDGSGVLARPIPGGVPFLAPQSPEIFHVFLVGPANELSTITDFSGFLGAAHVQGPATRTLADGTTTTLYADYDMRFMQGRYIGVDGRLHRGTFSFF